MGSDVEEILVANGIDPKAPARPAAAAATRKEQPPSKKRKLDKSKASSAGSEPPRKGPKLSTGIHLLEPSAGAGTAVLPSVAAKSGLAAGKADVPEALKQHHPTIQAAMAALGFIEPTPVQEKCWPLLCKVRLTL